MSTLAYGALDEDLAHEFRSSVVQSASDAVRFCTKNEHFMATRHRDLADSLTKSVLSGCEASARKDSKNVSVTILFTLKC